MRRYGMVWVWWVWYGMGMVGYGYGMVCVWYGYGMVWYGMVWHGMVWYGMVWYGMVWVWYGMVWYGIFFYRDKEGHAVCFANGLVCDKVLPEVLCAVAFRSINFLKQCTEHLEQCTVVFPMA